MMVVEKKPHNILHIDELLDSLPTEAIQKWEALERQSVPGTRRLEFLRQYLSDPALTLEQVGSRNGVSAQRVGQLVHKTVGILYHSLSPGIRDEIPRENLSIKKSNSPQRSARFSESKTGLSAPFLRRAVDGNIITADDLAGLDRKRRYIVKSNLNKFGFQVKDEK